MSKELPRVDTPVATITYTAKDRVEVRYKPGLRFSVEGMLAMMKARQQLGSTGRHRVLMLLPEVIEFDTEIVRTDHYSRVPQPNTEAVAWVVHNEGDAHITRMILRNSDPGFPYKVFMDEAEAREWLESIDPTS